MKRAISLGFAALLLHVVLTLPNYLGAVKPATFGRFALEWPAILLCLIALSGHRYMSRFMGGLFTVFLLAMVLIKLADMASFEAFSRPFNPIVDFFLIGAGLDLLAGSIGTPLTVFVVLGVICAVIILTAALIWAIALMSRLRPGRWRWPVAALAATFAILSIVEAGHVAKLWRLPRDLPGTALTTRLAYKHVSDYALARRDLAEFNTATQSDPYDKPAMLFDRLKGRDVLVIFIESYGRTSFDNPLYAPTHLDTLHGAEARLARAGFEMRSGWLRSPTSGGQSWLAHGSFASGLRTGDQSRYSAMLASPRQSLYHLARRAGYRTAAVMPAITLAWPESQFLGFETILAAKDLGYKGVPFNWVTMPDQYTLHAYGDILGPDPRPDFLQIALISSHAPWVPIPPLIDWNDVGNGQVFDQWANSGDTPKVVWRDRDRVRDQYRKAIDYALQSVFSYAARRAGDAPLMLILGDHPPAGFVSQIEGTDVPIHAIGPPEVIALLEGWGWGAGLIPSDTTPSWPMEAFRNKFIDAVSSEVVQSRRCHETSLACDGPPPKS